jgi:DNA-binding PadR family transcriptional regulator
MAKITQDDWDNKLVPVLWCINEDYEGYSVIPNLEKKVDLARSTLLYWLQKAEDLGYLKKVDRLNGIFLKDRLIWKITNKGRKILE